jgi:two-component system LytT family sensor kinase
MKNELSLIKNKRDYPAGAKINWPMWAIIFGFWTLFSFLYANQIYFEMLHNPNMHHSWWRIAFWQLTVWYLWGFLSPLILHLGRAVPVDGDAKLRGVLLHIGACVLLAAFHIAAATGLRMLIRPFDVWSDRNPFLIQYRAELKSFFLFDVLVYWAVFGVAYAFDYRERYRERQSQASRLEAQLAQAQLESLKMQLHPHFLFNTLHTIAGLVRGNEKEHAVNMIAGLSELLRRALERADEQEVRLKDELKFIELYLDIQKVRFSDRLSVETSIAPETLEALVPNLILQPLVENALRHGIALKQAPGLLTIKTVRENGSLRITVSDDGPGLKPDWQLQEHGGIGVANTGERLKHLYGAQHEFALLNDECGGTTAFISIPFRTKLDS